MSKQLLPPRADPVTEAAVAAAEFGAAVDLVDEAAAAALGINRTDLRILGLVRAAGSLTAAAVARAAALSPAATTTAIQRLVAAGYLTRTVDPADRRRAVLAATPAAERRATELYAPVEQAGRAILAGYSAAELALISGFLRRGTAMQTAEADRIRSLG